MILNLFTDEAAAAAQLSLKDLQFGGLVPNGNISASISKVEKKYKVDFSVNEETHAHFTGDPSPAMAWFLSMTPDAENKIVQVEYEQFNSKSPGFTDASIKGIKIGSSLAQLEKVFGKTKNRNREKAYPYKYITQTYNLTVKETGQQATIQFLLRYPEKQKEVNAKVYGFSYSLTPKVKEKPKKTTTPVIEPDNTQIVVRGHTIRTGMTQDKVIKLLGKPNEINAPMHSTGQNRQLMRELLGDEYFNSLDIQQWSYIYTSNGRDVEAYVIFFDYKGIVTEAIRVM